MALVGEATQAMLLDIGIKSSVKFDIMSETVPKVETSNIIIFIFFSVIFLLMIVGWIVEYSPLFGKAETSKDMTDCDKDKLLVESKSGVGKAFLAFSPARNMRKMFFSPPQKDRDLDVLNGVRVLAMAWVVLGHAYFSAITVPASNMGSLGTIMEGWFFPIVPGGLFAVDIFFFLSAFLATYLMASKFYKSRVGPVKILQIYLHRYLRLIPVIIGVILFVIGIYSFTGSGPLWSGFASGWESGCKRRWWTNLLFVSNIVGVGQGCIDWTWYLGCDMQFFLFLPLLVLFYSKNRMGGYVATWGLLLANLVATFTISIYFHAGVSMLNDLGMGVTYLYFKPWIRVGAYLVGTLFGFAYFEYKNSEKHSL